jgi:hypothetical protein
VPGYEEPQRTEPPQPGGGPIPVGQPPPAKPAAETSDIAALEGMLERIRQMQKDILVRINRSRGTPESPAQQEQTAQVRQINSGIESTLSSADYRNLVARLQSQDPAVTRRDYRHIRIFADGGKIAVIDRTQESIRSFLSNPSAGAASPGGKPAGALPPGPPPGGPPPTGGKDPGQTGPMTAAGTAAASAGAQAAPGATQGPATGGPSGQTAGSPGASAGASASSLEQARARVPLVPNSYGVTPAVFTDDQIRAILDPLIDAELARENAKLGGKGLTMNKYRQLVGTSGGTVIRSAGRPDYDHYREWLKASPGLLAAVNEQARTNLDSQARALAASTPPVGGASAAPAPAPGPAPAPSGNPAAQSGTAGGGITIESGR